ncbi:MAG: Omp28 family outer membrane lipoprotein [Bacteroides sp.]|nr:Omp28 family outer membrane lipoprotein [Bacteroides sp.]
MILHTYSKLPLFGAALALAAGMSSCDNVEPADRYIEVPRPEIARKVLIQEFTGIQCVNCPTGALTVHELQEQYPGSIIAVGMHPSGTPYSGPVGKFDLNSAEADIYYAFYKPMGFPAAVVDGQSAEINISAWGGLVNAALSQAAPAEISLENVYDASTRTLTVDYEVTFNSGYSSNLRMNLWLVESGIVGPQKSGSIWVRDYVHNHVLRESLTGDWGESLGSSFHLDDSVSGTASIKLSEDYVAENCAIVAFIQNDARLVEQCEEAPVIKSADDSTPEE